MEFDTKDIHIYRDDKNNIVEINIKKW
jgi:hypothetical protein